MTKSSFCKHSRAWLAPTLSLCLPLRQYAIRIIRTGLLLPLLCTTAVLALPKERLEQVMLSRYGQDGVSYLRTWSDLIQLADLSTEQKLQKVNDFFNQGVSYAPDDLLWKSNDYWATPLQTMGVRAGDCEDYSIAKYFSLLKMGIPASALRLIYVKATTGGIVQAHMVLGYFPEPNAIPLILDNLNPAILPADQRPDLTPVFSFNSEGLWLGNRKSNTDPTARLSRWRDLLQRMQEEGFQQ